MENSFQEVLHSVVKFICIHPNLLYNVSVNAHTCTISFDKKTRIKELKTDPNMGKPCIMNFNVIASFSIVKIAQERPDYLNLLGQQRVLV